MVSETSRDASSSDFDEATDPARSSGGKSAGWLAGDGGGGGASGAAGGAEGAVGGGAAAGSLEGADGGPSGADASGGKLAAGWAESESGHVTSPSTIDTQVLTLLTLAMQRP
jgi:hypothetical protein